MAKGDDIEARLGAFATQVLDICDRHPKITTANHTANQLMRCGTAAGANYAEARGAESRTDFIHKLGIVLKELNESKYWLERIIQRKLMIDGSVEQAYSEGVELCKIIAVSRRTAAERAGRIQRA